jgi:hypothetical protein
VLRGAHNRLESRGCISVLPAHRVRVEIPSHDDAATAQALRNRLQLHASLAHHRRVGMAQIVDAYCAGQPGLGESGLEGADSIPLHVRGAECGEHGSVVRVVLAQLLPVPSLAVFLDP